MSKRAKKIAEKDQKRTLYASGFSRGGDYSCVFISRVSQSKRRRLERGQHR